MNLILTFICCLFYYVFSIDTIQCLFDFYDATGGPYWDIQTNWPSQSQRTGSEDICTFYGILCADNVMTDISLANNGLTGSFPSCVSFLTLDSIDVSNNDMQGDIPSLPDMMYALSTKFNSFTSLPINMADLTGVQYLHADFNPAGTSSAFSASWFHQELQVMGLTDNGLAGTLDQSMWGTKAETVLLGGNKLTGELPAMPNGFSFAASHLETLDLSDNSLSGAIPDLSTLAALEELDLNYNGFQGDINDISFPEQSHLVVLDLKSNLLGGAADQLLPDLLEALPGLIYLRVGDNGLSGWRPEVDTGDRVVVIEEDPNPWLCRAGQDTHCTGITVGDCEDHADHTVCTLYTDSRLPAIQPAASIAADLELVDSGTPYAVTDLQTDPDNEYGLLATTTAGARPTSVRYRSTPITAPSEQEQEQEQAEQAALAVADPSPLTLTVFGMASCPDFSSGIVDLLLHPAVRPILPYFQIDIRALVERRERYATGLWAMHGQAEAVGDLAIMCASSGPSPASEWLGLDLCECLYPGGSTDDVPGGVTPCLESLVGDPAARVGLDACRLGDEGLAISDEDSEVAALLNASWSPTFYLGATRLCLWHSTPCIWEGPLGMASELCTQLLAETGWCPRVCQDYC